MLVMISSPSDYPPLDVDKEWAQLADALRPLQDTGALQVQRLGSASLEDLRHPGCQPRRMGYPGAVPTRRRRGAAEAPSWKARRQHRRSQLKTRKQRPECRNAGGSRWPAAQSLCSVSRPASSA
jgi:hypothetical protein